MVSGYKCKLSVVAYVLVVAYLAAASPADISKESASTAVDSKLQDVTNPEAATNNQQPVGDAPLNKPHEKEPPTDKAHEAELPKDKPQTPSSKSDENPPPSKSEPSQKPSASRNQVPAPEPMPADLPREEMEEPTRPTPGPSKERPSLPVAPDTSEPRGPSDTKPAARKEKDSTRATPAPQPTADDNIPAPTRSRSTKWVTLTDSPAEKGAHGRAQETDEASDEASNSNPSGAHSLAMVSGLPITLALLSASIYRHW
ncbi:hypothetical protein H4R34_001841 [Dimargaris verticillata]|uniref:Uncharacterized protein n=1 Tax=Dimargaris verticillata TaxID=2761393 RepID=A0A9W8EAJ2_9FUNG|nr:hypothetical protein H4R34_001841 [Dimargaris verticillata]